MRTSMATEEVWHHQGVSHSASAQVKDGGFVSGWCNEQRKDDKCTRKEMIRLSVTTAESRLSVHFYKIRGSLEHTLWLTAAHTHSQWPNLADYNSGANLCKSFTTGRWRAGCTEATCCPVSLCLKWTSCIHSFQSQGQENSWSTQMYKGWQT